jgi:hypothetical protein
MSSYTGSSVMPQSPMITRNSYFAGAMCLVFFLASQAFQEIAYRFWIRTPHTPQDELLIYLLKIDQVRAFLVLAGILALAVPFCVIAIRCLRAAPLASTLGLTFGAAFIFFELSQRAAEILVVGQNWANTFSHALSASERDAILQRFAAWNEAAAPLTFCLRLSYLLGSLAFARATWKAKAPARWGYLATVAFLLNALRLLARLLSTFAAQAWLNGFNDQLYFPAVFIIIGMLTLWFFLMARSCEPTGAGADSAS